MSTRSRTVTKEALQENPMKRQLDMSDEPSDEVDTDLLREPIWKTSRSHRLEFGETSPYMQFRCLDLVPAVQIDFDSGSASSCEEGKTIFTSDQGAALEAKFRRKKYPTRQEKVEVASKLGVDICKVQNWFMNRRRKLKKEQRKGAVGPSGVRPVLSGVSMTQTSCKRSFKSTVGFEGFPQFPAQCHDVPKQPRATTPFLAAASFASASHHTTQSFQSYTARCTGTLRLQQSPSVPHVKAPGHLPYQLCLPFPGPTERISQHQLVSNRLPLQTAATSHLAHYPPPAVKAVKQDFSQLPAADSSHLTDEFPFSFSIAKELPHIFGNLQDDQILDRPLTPSFELPIEPDPGWEKEESLAFTDRNDYL